MELGNFSLSLAVKDIEASRAFYEKLGFTAFGGGTDQGWLIMTSPTCVIGLFQGMLERNTLTFNPGWDPVAGRWRTSPTSARSSAAWKADGVTFVSEADEDSTGPANCIVVDPDGNPILIDQHV